MITKFQETADNIKVIIHQRSKRLGLKSSSLALTHDRVCVPSMDIGSQLVAPVHGSVGDRPILEQHSLLRVASG